MNNTLKISYNKDIYLRAKQTKFPNLYLMLEIHWGHLLVIQNKCR